MAEAINNNCVVQCKNCGKTVTATWHSGLFKKGWTLPDTKGACPACRKPIDIKGIETALCPHCHTLVEKTEDNICLSCNKHLSTPAFRTKVACPECGVMQGIPVDHTGDYSCHVCGTVISARHISQNAGKAAVETEQYIRLPDVARMQKEGFAVWKHPMNSFPFKSRMQVNEGTYGVLLQNGVCKEACAPGDYLLEKSSLDTSKRFDAALDADDVVFQVDIYSVLQDLPELQWGAASNPLMSQEKTASYVAGGKGRVALQVCDAAAYMRYLGFKAIPMADLTFLNKEPGAKDGLLIQLVRDQLADILFTCLSGRPAAQMEGLVPNDIQDDAAREMNKRLAEMGLCVKDLRITDLVINQTARSETAEKIRQVIQRERDWAVPQVGLADPAHKEHTAVLDFAGRYRLRVADETRFFGLPEIQAFAQSFSEVDLAALLGKKVQSFLENELAVVAMESLRNGSISDLLDTARYAPAMRHLLTARVNENLSADGLALDRFDLYLPSVKDKSIALQNSMDLPRKRQTLQKAVESVLMLATKPIRVHAKGEPSIYVDIAFEAKAGMRIRHLADFFQMSEVQALLEADEPAIRKLAADHYKQRLDPLFQEIIGRTLQSMVDQTNADIRELHRFTGILKENLRANLDERINRWGLGIESLDMDELRYVNRSANLDNLAEAEQVKSGASLQQEIERIQNSHQIFTAQESSRVQLETLDIGDRLSQKQDELALRRQEREYALQMAKLRKEDDLDKLADEILKGQKERDAQVVLEEYRRAFKLKEEQLEAANRADRMQLEAGIAQSMRQQQAEYEKKLNDAENQRALNEVMRKIDESNLTWKQKLDEYDRLRRLTMAKDTAETAKMQDETYLQIQREKNELYYQTENTKIRLSAEEAKLFEEIKLYDEQRQERIQQAMAAREERRAILSFEQRLQERSEQAAQQMEQLNAQYAQALALREKEADLQKLTKQLEAAVSLSDIQSKTDQAKAKADSDAAIAKAQAEAKRLDEHQAREESIAKQAMELKMTILEMQNALETVRLGNARNQDDRMAEVAISANQAQKKNADQATGERLNSLTRKMDAIISNYKALEKQVKELKERYPIGWAGRPQYPGYPNPYGSPYPMTPPAPYYSAQQPGVVNTMPCPQCKQDIPTGTKVCHYCGTMIL